MNHERCRIPNYNKYIAEYAKQMGALAINTALTIKHEVVPPKPEPLIIDSKLVILDDERAIIKGEDV